MLMRKTTLYLVRHGKTEWNTLGLMQGWGDSPLTEEGLRGARAVRDSLRNIPFVAAYSSTSQRAIDTARIILESHPAVPLETTDDLREIYFGQWEGQKYQQLEVDFAEEHRNLMFHPDRYVPTHSAGETYPTMLERMERGLRSICHKHRGSTVLVVSHGMSLASIMKHLQGVPLKDLRVNSSLPNCSISTIDYDGQDQFHITAFGRTDHLPDENRR